MSNGTITRRGKASWRIKYDLPRDRETGERRIAYATVKGPRREAEKELRARLSAIDRGVHIDPTRETVAEWLDSWLDTVAPQTVAPKALERYRGLARNQIKPHLGTIQIQKLRPAHVDRWIKTLIAENRICNRTIRHAHSVLRGALGHAAKIEVVERNVATIIKPPKAVKPAIKSLTESQMAETLEKLEGHSFYPVAAFAIGTGARCGEIAGLIWSDVDLEARTVTIQRSIEQTMAGLRAKQPKTAAGKRMISLPAIVVDALRDHRRQTLELRMGLGMGALPPDAPVFGKIEGDWSRPFSFSDRWRDVVKSRKLPKITFHGLRHSHASALIAQGVDIVTVSHRLGHQSPAFTLSTYSHLFSDNDSKVAAAIDAVFS